jgi:hypothetical protein
VLLPSRLGLETGSQKLFPNKLVLFRKTFFFSLRRRGKKKKRKKEREKVCFSSKAPVAAAGLFNSCLGKRKDIKCSLDHDFAINRLFQHFSHDTCSRKEKFGQQIRSFITVSGNRNGLM